MRLETDPDVLVLYRDEQWDALLKAAWHFPHPGFFVIVPERVKPVLRPFLPVEHVVHPKKEGLDDRRMYIIKRLEEGATRSAVAVELGVSAGLITRIMKGERR